MTFLYLLHTVKYTYFISIHCFFFQRTCLTYSIAYWRLQWINLTKAMHKEDLNKALVTCLSFILSIIYILRTVIINLLHIFITINVWLKFVAFIEVETHFFRRIVIQLWNARTCIGRYWNFVNKRSIRRSISIWRKIES